MAKPSGIPPKKEVRIVVLQRGWVIVGYYTRTGDQCRVEKASVIRRWGTTKGIGELASGPLDNTKLDPTNGPVEFHQFTQVHSIIVDAAKWEKHLQ